MALNGRQERVYTSRCSIYREARTTNLVTGKTTEGAPALVAASVPCRYVYTQNDDDPQGIGRLKRRSALTEDELHLDVAVDVRSNDIILDTTGNANDGTYHRVMGAPRQLPNSGSRRTNKQVARIFEDEKLGALFV